jgi:hypothetical protein
MKSRLVFNDPHHLGELHDIIHDRWFAIEDLTYKQSEARIDILFSAPPWIQKGEHGRFVEDRHASLVWWILSVHNVIDVAVEDTEKIGTYDFNVVRFDARKGIVSIETGVPAGIKVRVTAFLVTLEADV